MSSSTQGLRRRVEAMAPPERKAFRREPGTFGTWQNPEVERGWSLAAAAAGSDTGISRELPDATQDA